MNIVEKMVKKKYDLDLLKKQKDDFIRIYNEQKKDKDRFNELLDKSNLTEKEKKELRAYEPFVDENLLVEANRLDKLIKGLEKCVSTMK